MPNYIVSSTTLPQPMDEGRVIRLPLREQVARCLEEWDILSDSSADSDDFCGWRVGSRALPVPRRPASSAGSYSASGHRPLGSREAGDLTPCEMLAARIHALRGGRTVHMPPRALPLTDVSGQPLPAGASGVAYVASKHVNDALNHDPFSIIVIDVRQRHEYEGGHIRGAFHFDWQNMQHGQLLEVVTTHYKRRSQASAVVFYCDGSLRSREACLHLGRDDSAAGRTRIPALCVLHDSYVDFCRQWPLLCDREGGDTSGSRGKRS